MFVAKKRLDGGHQRERRFVHRIVTGIANDLDARMRIALQVSAPHQFGIEHRVMFTDEHLDVRHCVQAVAEVRIRPRAEVIGEGLRGRVRGRVLRLPVDS